MTNRPTPHSSLGVTVPRLVGRERELVELRSALDQVLAGHGQVLLLTGEPGIGKTRLAEELTADAETRGCRVLWGRCFEWEGAPPYWPWIEILRRAIQAVPVEQLASLAGPGAADIAQVVPELRERLPDLPEPTVTEPEAARFRLFEGIRTFLHRLGDAQPLVIVMDDLHWADAPSLALFQFVAQHLNESRVLALATYRNVEVARGRPLAQTLAELARERWVRRVMLRGLSQEDVAAFIASAAHEPVASALVELVHTETEGNPFFVGEVVRLLAAEGQLTEPADGSRPRLRVPESVREVVGRRLNRLSEGCNEVLSIACVIGRDFSLRVLQPVSGRGIDELLEALEESVDARLIDELELVGHYRFSHALVRETLYEELRTARRVRLHGQVGAALERIHTRDLDSHAAELAYHYAEAAPAGFAEQAVAYASQAAERAMTRFAWESAIERYQLALQMLDLLDEPEPQQEIELLLMLGEAQERMATGRPHTGRYEVAAGGSPSALATFRHAVDLARKAGTPEQFAYAALGVVGFNPLPQLGGVEGMRFLEEALERLPDHDSPLRVRLLARLGVDPYVVVSFYETSLPTELGDQLRARCDAAIAMARRLGDPASLAYALVMSGLQAELRTDDEWLAIADEAVEVATAAAERPLLVWALGSKRFALEKRGDIAAQRGVMDHLARVAAEFRMPFVLWVVAAVEASAALATGGLAEAEQYLDQADHIQPRSAWGTNVRIALRREQGRGEELHDLVAVIGPWSSPWEHVLRLVCQLETGHIDAAREGLDSLAAEAIAYEGIGRRRLAWLAEVCAGLGSIEHAERCYDILLPFAGRSVPSGDSTDIAGCTSYYLGLLATTMRHWDMAEQHFGEALTKNAEWGYRLHVAYTQYAWAEMLTRRRRSSDRERAAALLGQARAAADELGLVRLRLLIAALDERRSPSAEARPAGLSPREIEVLRLAAEGLTDAEIAARLFLSPRTISSHLTTVYNKLGVSSRMAATRLAQERGII